MSKLTRQGLVEYSAWSDPERIAVNVDSLYREFSGAAHTTDVFELFPAHGRTGRLPGRRCWRLNG